jgi:hypothetical protein
MFRNIFIFTFTFLFFANSVYAQYSINFQLNSHYDSMTRETSLSYAGTSLSGHRIGFFCDSDGLNFSIGYDYMIYEEDQRLEYRIGESQIQQVRPNLVSSDGEYAWFFGNEAFLSSIVNGIASRQEILIRFYERVNGTHTFSLLGGEDIFALECASSFRPLIIDAPVGIEGSGEVISPLADPLIEDSNSTELPIEPTCLNTCRFAHDGECDDGGPGSLYNVCEYGTDCSDCSPRN